MIETWQWSMCANGAVSQGALVPPTTQMTFNAPNAGSSSYRCHRAAESSMELTTSQETTNCLLYPPGSGAIGEGQYRLPLLSAGLAQFSERV